ncbi:MAG: TIGR04219 family outer membrane beta-barrel protein [Cellvibrio sp.]|uniref:TIGR04219 family outer membrane beta-barrel protein n=1 Tax=Cellvibrio sp. TaxID=1965322 RepID=UPI00271AEDCB|nr:TIGR04219 family outer membrane beta-barrel protein [Cellvibrio sp.]
MKLFSTFARFSLSSIALTVTCHTYADTVLGVYAGAGTWQSEYAGDIGKPATSANDLGMGDNNNNFYYIAIEHPVPFFPNVKLQQNNITSKQTSILENNLSIGNITYPSGSTVATDFDLSYTDAALYYELLDNWLTLDVGVTLRKYSGHLQAESASLSDKTDIDISVPLAYGHMQFDLPLTGFFAGFEGNYISYDGNDLADYSAKIGYSFDSALDLGVEVGYRALTVNIDDDDAQTNLDIKGPYAAAIFHF